MDTKNFSTWVTPACFCDAGRIDSAARLWRTDAPLVARSRPRDRHWIDLGHCGVDLLTGAHSDSTPSAQWLIDYSISNRPLLSFYFDRLRAEVRVKFLPWRGGNSMGDDHSSLVDCSTGYYLANHTLGWVAIVEALGKRRT